MIHGLITGRPARGIVNRLMREVDDAVAPEFPLATAAIAPLPDIGLDLVERSVLDRRIVLSEYRPSGASPYAS